MSLTIAMAVPLTGRLASTKILDVDNAGTYMTRGKVTVCPTGIGTGDVVLTTKSVSLLSKVC